MRTKIVCLSGAAIVLLALLAGCGATALPREAIAPEAPAAEVVKLVEQDAGTGSSVANAGGEATVERMIIWNAQISLTVEDAKQAADRVQAIARSLGGYTVGTEAWLSGEQLQARLTIRVPAGQFEAAMAQLRDLGIKVNHESANSEDVTDEYVDLGSRLRHLEAKEAQLLKFLDKAEDTEAVLAVYQQLSATQAEIEQVKGRMAYLEKLAAMATITVDLLPEELEAPVVEEGWNAGRTLRNAARALVDTLQWLGRALIWIAIYIAPVLVLIALPVLLVVWLVRRRLRRRKPAA